MAAESWECTTLSRGYVITKKWDSTDQKHQEAEEEAIGAVQNLIAWLGITKYQLVREDDAK